MLILSWNVAGLSTTVNRVHESYCPRESTLSNTMSVDGATSAFTDQKNNGRNKRAKRTLRPSAALESYFARHGADIICLQEHKIPKSQLSSRSEPRQCSKVEGYESFWSCCVDEKKKGLNGVVTYAKVGTVQSANAAPLGSPELDNQGRCVMTDHGSFVVFNVYVPASGGQPLAYKMKFLNALRLAMRRQREVFQKAVILVGDLNITLGPQDVYWQDRVIYVDEIVTEIRQAQERNANGSTLPKWKYDIAEHWPTIVSALETKKVESTQTANSITGEQYAKFRLTVRVGDRKVYLGKNEASPEYCEYSYDFSARNYLDEESQETVLAQEPNAIRINILTELMLKIGGVVWDENTMRSIATSKDATVRRISPPRNWLQSLLLTEEKMVDVFRHFYPTAEARFTCWNQFTNRRYVNEGCRIDYTLVDNSILQYVKQGEDGSFLRQHGAIKDVAICLTEAAAISAATANGGYQPASFGGGGIQEATQTVLDTQFGPPHTGMVYTPPSFSDHIGVSLLLDDAIQVKKNLVLNESDPATRKSQPQKQQMSISSFFAGQSVASGNVATSAASAAALTTSRLSARPAILSAAKKRGSDLKGSKAKSAGKRQIGSSSILNHFRKN